MSYDPFTYAQEVGAETARLRTLVAELADAVEKMANYGEGWDMRDLLARAREAVEP